MPPLIIEHEEYPSVVVIEYNSIYRNELQNFIHNIIAYCSGGGNGNK